ncbi:Tox-REase-5 domain-containing protein [Orbaceae bacterium ESL0721]|nr:Tox-REase-5 domain-containing protein [Orbaceae bacterium ESL0721]
MFFPLMTFYGQQSLLMSASVESYRLNQEAKTYPFGYEIGSTSFKPISLEAMLSATLYPSHHTYPYLQDGLIYTLILRAFNSKKIPPPVSDEVIDLTDSQEIEPDNDAAIALLEREIELLKQYHIDNYQHELNLLESHGCFPFREEQLKVLLAESKKQLRLLESELELTKLWAKRRLSPEEREFIKATAAERMVVIKEPQRGCRCSIKPHMRKEIFRRNMSDLSADYQTIHTEERWERNMNPKSGKLSVQINEWIYEGPAGRCDFDGWLHDFCILLEMKANYDSLMFSKTKIDPDTGLAKLKDIGKEKLYSLRRQAENHDRICAMHPNARCCWIFMTKLAYSTFIELIDDLPNITAIYVPLNKDLL